MNIEGIREKYCADESLSSLYFNNKEKYKKYGSLENVAKAKQRITSNNALSIGVKNASKFSDDLNAIDRILMKYPSNGIGNRNIDGFISDLRNMVQKGRKIYNVAFKTAARTEGK